MRLGRILGMGPREIAGRTRQEIDRWLDRPPPGSDCAEASDDFARALLQGDGERFFAGALDPATPALLTDRQPEACRMLVRRAEALCRGRFDLLGYRGLSFGSPIDWNLDPISGRRAPRVRASRIDPLDVGLVGDAKVIWELGRCQWLVTLGQAYAISGDERYVRRILRAVEDFADENPPGAGIHWTSSLEIALRLVAWSWAIRLVRGSPLLTAERLARIGRILGLHAASVERRLSHWFSPNTHLTGEALGLYYAGVTLAELPGAPNWRREGARILIREIERQVLPDGVYFEESTAYQRYTVEIYLHFLVLAARVGDAVPSFVRERLARAIDFLVSVRRPDGAMPAIGDADGGWILPLATREPDALSGIFSTAAVLFGRSDWAWAAGGLAPETIWLLGPSAARDFDALAPAPPNAPPCRLFTHGGWAVLRDDWQGDGHQVLFDVGPLGCPSSGGHGHADLLSLQASFFGEPFLVDAGTYVYAERAWRNAFRQTAMHSTVTVDGRSQAEPDGPFSWKRRPESRVERWSSRGGRHLVTASHDAFGTRADPIVHRRTLIVARPHRFVVIDEIEGRGVHDVEVRWQLAPAVRAVRRGVRIHAHGRRGVRLDLRTYARAPVDVEIIEGERNPAVGWVSPDYGRIVPAPHVVFRARARLPVRIVTLLVPKCVGSPAS